MENAPTAEKPDADLDVLKDCIAALDRSTTRTMLAANIRFLTDRYLSHPTTTLPDHLKP